jgi:hypothetical protein
VRSQRTQGLTSVLAFCHTKGCHHSGAVPFDYFPDELPIPEIAPLLKCSKCGNRRVTVMTNMHEFYALCRAHGIGVA